jgi:hypothetical protein
MFGRRSFLTLIAIGTLAGAPALAAQAPAHPRPRAEWRWGRDHWAGHGVRLERRGVRLERRGKRLERRGMRYRHQRMWLRRRELHRFRQWDRSRDFARHSRHRQWDGII